MTPQISQRPKADEFAPFYNAYVALVPDGDILETLEHQLTLTLDLLSGISEQQSDSRYAPDKWSIKQLVGHITDTERIFAYRLLRIARGDETPLPGFEQNDYVRYAAFDNCKLSELAREFELVRYSSLMLMRQLDARAWERTGTASETRISVRALAYIIAGHELHHVGILQQRYLPTLT